MKFALVFSLAILGSFPAWSSPGRLRIRAVQTAKAVGPMIRNQAIQTTKAAGPVIKNSSAVQSTKVVGPGAKIEDVKKQKLVENAAQVVSSKDPKVSMQSSGMDLNQEL